MTRTAIDRLTINSPYAEPMRYWRYERETRTSDVVLPIPATVTTPGCQPWTEMLMATRPPDMVVRLIEQSAPVDELGL